jgi:hypothetical protein
MMTVSPAALLFDHHEEYERPHDKEETRPELVER